MADTEKEARAQAEALLEQIRLASHLLFSVQADCTLELDRVNQKYAGLAREYQKAVSAHEKSLEKLVRKHKAAILAGRDRAQLTNGSVMLKLEKRVKRVKGMLARIQAAGLKALIKYARPSVDWDQVDKLPDADLAGLGTERVEKEWFSYEVKGFDGTTAGRD